MLQTQNSEFSFTYYDTRLGLVHRFVAYFGVKLKAQFVLKDQNCTWMIIFNTKIHCCYFVFHVPSNYNLILVAALMLGPTVLKLFCGGGKDGSELMESFG